VNLWLVTALRVAYGASLILFVVLLVRALRHADS